MGAEARGDTGCYLAAKRYEFRTAEIASFLGVNPAAVSISAQKRAMVLEAGDRRSRKG